MANVTRDVTASIDAASAMYATQLSDGLTAGVDLPACSPCFVDNNGLVQLCDGTALDAKVIVDGINARKAKAGEAVTLFGVGTKFSISAAPLSTTIRILYLSATAGEWADAATTGDAKGTARVINTATHQVCVLLRGNVQ